MTINMTIHCINHHLKVITDTFTIVAFCQAGMICILISSVSIASNYCTNLKASTPFSKQKDCTIRVYIPILLVELFEHEWHHSLKNWVTLCAVYIFIITLFPLIGIIAYHCSIFQISCNTEFCIISISICYTSMNNENVQFWKFVIRIYQTVAKFRLIVFKFE